MKETYYQFDDQKFKKCIKEYYMQKPEWKKKNAVGISFFVIAALLTVVPAAVYGVKDPVGFFAILAVGFIFGLIIAPIGAIIRSRGTWKYGKPYECMTKPFLFSNYSGIQFGYHDRYDQKNKTSAIVHQIAYSNIHSVDVSEQKHLVTVYGSIERVEYEDLMTNRITHSFTDGQLGDRGSFSFFLCFDEQDAFFDNLKEHNVKVNFV